MIAVQGLIASEMLQSLLDAEEDACVNGMTGTHSDTALSSWNVRSRWEGSLGGSSDHRRAWTGLRHSAFASGCTTSAGGAVLDADAIIAHRAKLDSPHGVNGSLIFVDSREV